LIVFSGLPASGKTTLASAIAAKLGFPLIDKDAYLEELFNLEGVGSREDRRNQSKRADALFREAALAAHQAVLASWWKHPRSSTDSGTSFEWLRHESAPLVEVHCSCRAVVAADRFLTRVRHPGHLDKERAQSELLAMFEQQQSFGPLFPQKAITVNTEQQVNLPALVLAIQAALQVGRDA
jgi:predicted kinase